MKTYSVDRDGEEIENGKNGTYIKVADFEAMKAERDSLREYFDADELLLALIPKSGMEQIHEALAMEIAEAVHRKMVVRESLAKGGIG